MNNVSLGGNIGQDPELRTTQSGKTCLRFSLATSESWKDKNGQKQERTEWHRIVIWGTRAEGLSRHLSKGQKLCVTGKITYRKYEDREGVTKYTTEIVANDVTFMGGGQGRSNGGGSSSAPQQDANTGGFGDDDDIPF